MSEKFSDKLIDFTNRCVDWTKGLPGRISDGYRDSFNGGNVGRPAAIRKVSDRAIEREMHIVWKRYERAQGWSKGVRHGLIVFGVTAAIFLPFLQPNSPSST